jgi:hypothetical protein
MEMQLQQLNIKWSVKKIQETNDLKMTQHLYIPQKTLRCDRFVNKIFLSVLLGVDCWVNLYLGRSGNFSQIGCIHIIIFIID